VIGEKISDQERRAECISASDVDNINQTKKREIQCAKEEAVPNTANIMMKTEADYNM